jgi:wobble nucleotide-excising tRNase
MRVNCEKAKQLFVLTHNFTFFKLVRDWISKKNKKENQNIANFYVVKASSEVPRSSTYTDAEAALVLYNSEYHYIFSRLNSLRNQQTLETDDHFLAANLSRKLLESFLSFKFPKNRGNFANLFNVAVSASKKPEDEKKEKIRKFINEYSHNDLIEINEDFVENLIGESAAVISDIFDWIQELDEQHYNEMMEVSAN